MPSAIIQPGVLTPEECEAVIEAGRRLPLGEGEAASKNYAPGTVRHCRVGWFLHGQNPIQTILDKALAAIRHLNETAWQFRLDGAVEPSQFTAYEPGHHFEWHLDVGGPGTNLRKLTSVVHLNPDTEYEGGALELHVEPAVRTAPRQVGAMILFPSYSLHRVAPITRGTRYTLVQWLSGTEPYR